jgi:hypothetical protein
MNPLTYVLVLLVYFISFILHNFVCVYVLFWCSPQTPTYFLSGTWQCNANGYSGNSIFTFLPKYVIFLEKMGEGRDGREERQRGEGRGLFSTKRVSGSYSCIYVKCFSWLLGNKKRKEKKIQKEDTKRKDKKREREGRER